MLDGSQLDWKSYRGKVVLVDFWATWCGPCRAEVPNVMKMYRDYHDKGFEVLGISLDDRREQAESYIKQEEIPWPTMFSDKSSERGWRHPMEYRALF
jgi:thiol-disulfide isomerase/thioredoxin